MKWLMVFIGGGLGSLARVVIGSMMAPLNGLFPWATLAANAVAAGVIGWLFASGVKSENELLWQLAAIGFCGGLSTFSTFSMETVQLMKAGHTMLAWAYVVLSVLLSMLLFYFITQWYQRI
jgi:CrcB protein